jgi:predicted outer membrane repeat protein
MTDCTLDRTPVKPTGRGRARRVFTLAAAAMAGLLAVAALMALLGGPLAARPAWAAPMAQTRIWPGGPAPCNAGLQACINGSAHGDTIVVQAGTYVTSVTLNRAVSLTGVSSATAVLQAPPGQRVLMVTGAAISNTVVISGLTFTGGNVTASAFCPEGCGGGIHVTGQAQPQFVNVIISGNSAHNGGGLYQSIGSLAMTGSQVINNTSQSHGGGVHLDGAAAAFSGSQIRGNRCLTEGCRGGGVYVSGGLAMTNTQVVSNTAHSHAGGAYATGTSRLSGGLFQQNSCSQAFCRAGGLYVLSPLTINGTQFISNSSTEHGAGVFANQAVTITGGLFRGNACSIPSCQGGGLFTFNTLMLNGTQFISNTTGGFGGGVRVNSYATLNGGRFERNACAVDLCQGGGLYASGVLTITGTHFVSNTARSHGGGLYATEQANVFGALFQGNSCTQSGCGAGGLLAANTLRLNASEFRNNSATAAGGGLVHMTSGIAYITNTLFAGNTAGSGVALNLAGPASVLLHNTIAAPSQVFSSAVRVGFGAVGITNTIFANHNTAIQRDGGSVFENYNLYSSVLNRSVGASVTFGGNSITGTAGFAGAAAGDYRLAAGSDAIDAGANAGVAVDFEGSPRPLGQGFDIGYHEFDPVLRLYLPLVVR